MHRVDDGGLQSAGPLRVRLPAEGAHAITTAEQKIADLQAHIESNRQLSTSLAFDA